MNTTTTTQAATTAPAGSRRKARLAGVVVALIAGLFGSAFLAAPANATGTSSTGISFCTSRNVSVTLQVWNGSTQQWQNYKNGTSGTTGCGTFRYVDAGYYYQVARTIAYGDPYCRTPRVVELYTTNWAQSQANRVVNLGTLYYRSTTQIC